MATPQYAVMQFLGLMSGKTYSKDVYVSDVAESRINFDSGSGASATSENFWRPPEPVLLTDYSQVTGTADTTKLQVTKNGIPTGDFLRYTVHLTSLNNRPRLAIGFPAGSEISAIQKA